MAAPGSIPASVIGLEVVSIQFLIPKAALKLVGHNIARLFCSLCTRSNYLFNDFMAKKKDEDKREGKGRRCCSGDRSYSINCHTSYLY